MSTAYEAIQICCRSIAGVTAGTYNENMVQAAKAATGIARDLTADEGELLLLQALTGDRTDTLPGMRQYWLTQPLPSLILDFTAGGTSAGFAGSLTNTNSTGGYVTDSAGNLRLVAANTLRISDLGLLVEQAATNLSTYSQDISQAGSWAFFRASLGATTTAPDGTNTAQFITENSGGNTHGVTMLNLTKAASAITYTRTLFIKPSSRTAVRLSLSSDNSLVNGAYTEINLTTGAVNASGTTGTGWTLVSAPAPVLYANGFWRVQITATSDAIAALFGFVMMENPLGTISYTGDGVSGLYVWGNQVEIGSVGTSYIATTTVAVTRSADVVALAGAAQTAAAAAKAAFFQTNLVGGGTSPRLFQANNSANLFFNSSTQASITDSGGDTANATIGGSGTYAGVVKSAFGFDATSMTAKANGGTQATSAHAWDGSGAITLGNNSSGTRALNGYMARVTFGATKGQFDGLTQ